MSITRCPKCNGQMERGFNLDRDGSVRHAKWAEGAARLRWWGSVELKNRRKYLVVADRCVKCGFMEHYATEETK